MDVTGSSGDLHLNPFYAYEGGSLEDSTHAAVLENNVTRALVITIEQTPGLGGRLVRFLVSRDRARAGLHLNARLDEKPIVDLQSGTSRNARDLVRQCKTRFILGISQQGTVPDQGSASDAIPGSVMGAIERVGSESTPHLKDAILSLVDDLQARDTVSDDFRGEVFSRLGEILGMDSDVASHHWVTPEALSYLADSLGGSRPDAWVIFPRSGVGVVLESKVRTELYDAQLRRHARDSLGSPGAPWVVCRWKDVYEFTRQERAIFPYVLGEYLEAVGVAGFTGVKDWSDENRNAEVVRALMEDALPGVSAYFHERGLDVSMEKKRTGSWFAYYVPGQKFYRNVHFTIALQDTGRLDFGLKIPNAASKATRTAFRSLLLNRSDFLSILASMRNAVPELWITVWQRHMRGKRWLYDMVLDATLEFDVDVVLDQASSVLHLKSFPSYLDMLEQIENGPFNKETTIVARYSIDPEDNRRSYVEGDLGRRYRRDPRSSDFVDEVVDLVRDFWPLFETLYIPP